MECLPDVKFLASCGQEKACLEIFHHGQKRKLSLTAQSFYPDRPAKMFVIVSRFQAIYPYLFTSERRMDKFIVSHIDYHMIKRPPNIEEDQITFLKFISRHALTHVGLFTSSSGEVDIKKLIYLFY